MVFPLLSKYVKLLDNIHINDGLRIVLEDEDYGLVLNEFYVNKKLVKMQKKLARIAKDIREIDLSDSSCTPLIVAFCHVLITSTGINNCLSPCSGTSTSLPAIMQNAN